MNRLHRTRNPSEIPGWGSAPGWGQPLPGWSPLVDHGPLPLRMAGSVARWWWPILALAGFAAVAGLVLGHDDSAPGLSTRGLSTAASIWMTASVGVLIGIGSVVRSGRVSGRPRIRARKGARSGASQRPSRSIIVAERSSCQTYSFFALTRLARSSGESGRSAFM